MNFILIISYMAQSNEFSNILGDNRHEFAKLYHSASNF